MVSIGADKSKQTVLREQSDQCLHCLSFHLHLLGVLKNQTVPFSGQLLYLFRMGAPVA